MGLIKTLIEEWKYRFGAPKPDDTKNDDTKPIWKAATFSWLCEQEGYGLATGGREQPPNGITYGSMTTIDGEGWSVICNLLNGRICFLSPDAPSHKLVPGFVLDLMEGARKVGTATIQSNTIGGWYDGLSEQDWKDIGFEKMPAVPGMMERVPQPWEDTTDGRVCLRCGKVNPAPQEDCTAGEEVPGGGMEPHIFDPKFKRSNGQLVYDFAAQDRNKQRAHRGRCATGGYCPHPTHKKDDKQYYDGTEREQIVPGSPEWRERCERFGCDESWWFCTNKFCRCNPDEQAPLDDFYCGCVRLSDDIKPERCKTCFSLMVDRDCVVERGSSRMCEYGTRGCSVVHVRWGVYGIVEQKFVGCSDQCDGSFESAIVPWESVYSDDIHIRNIAHSGMSGYQAYTYRGKEIVVLASCPTREAAEAAKRLMDLK